MYVGVVCCRDRAQGRGHNSGSSGIRASREVEIKVIYNHTQSLLSGKFKSCIHPPVTHAAVLCTALYRKEVLCTARLHHTLCAQSDTGATRITHRPPGQLIETVSTRVETNNPLSARPATRPVQFRRPIAVSSLPSLEGHVRPPSAPAVPWRAPQPSQIRRRSESRPCSSGGPGGPLPS